MLSTIIAIPCPPPMQAVASPYFFFRRRSSYSSVITSRVPVARPFSATPFVAPFCLAPGHLFPYPKPMEIHFAPETEKKLKDLAAQSGRKTADELVQEVIEGYFEELAQTRSMLNSRYDDLKDGSVKPIPGDEVAASFRDKSAAARRSQPGS